LLIISPARLLWPWESRANANAIPKTECSIARQKHRHGGRHGIIEGASYEYFICKHRFIAGACHSGKTARRWRSSAKQTTSLLGFDGFIDTIYHVVDQRQSASEYSRVHTLAEYGGRIVAAPARAPNVEIVPQNVKLGGNGPIMANAMCALGVPITYCGMTGYPTLNEVFRELADRAQLLPICDPALTDAVDFDDGKLIVGKHADGGRGFASDTLCSACGEAAWREAWQRSRFVAMVNWTMLPFLTELWQKIQADFPGGERKGAVLRLSRPGKAHARRHSRRRC
jgi:hypothetical protein